MGDAGMSYDYSPYNLYVNNLDETIDELQLRDAFSTYGEIASVKVMTDENLRSRGFGFVCFRSAEDATVAVTNMNETMLGSKCIYVTNARKKRLQDETTQNTTSPPNSTLGPQVFQPGGASYYVPAIPQAQRFYNPNQMPVRNNPRWPAQGQIRPGAQHAARFPGMQQQQMARPGIIPTVSWAQPAAFRAAMPNRGARRPPGAIPNTRISPGATIRPAFNYPSNMCNPGGSVLFPPNAVPKLGPQAPRFYSPNQMPFRNNLRWPPRGRQIRHGAQQAARFPGMQQQQMARPGIIPTVSWAQPAAFRAAMPNRGARRPPGAITNTGNPAGSVSLPPNAVPKVEETVAVLQAPQTKQDPGIPNEE